MAMAKSRQATMRNGIHHWQRAHANNAKQQRAKRAPPSLVDLPLASEFQS
jgi:hypothetical protein